MDYREYKKSAERHLKTCEFMYNHLEGGFLENHNEKKILYNIYYLSGYVIETALSYAFFSHIKCKGNVEDNSYYKDGFKTHNFNTKISYLQRVDGDLSELPFISCKLVKQQQAMYNKWTTDVRYHFNSSDFSKFTKENIRCYLDNVTIIYQTIIKRY